jgi:hypothetical protein
MTRRIYDFRREKEGADADFLTGRWALSAEDKAPLINYSAIRLIDESGETCTQLAWGEIMDLDIQVVNPLVALLAGILILLMPRLLNYVVAIYLIVIGILGLAHHFQ